MQMLGSFILGHASGAEQVHMEVHTQLHKASPNCSLHFDPFGKGGRAFRAGVIYI